jgi:hypothetical protein
MDELTWQIYPHGASRFELYEDDGRTNAYRRGAYALTSIACAAEPSRISVRIEAPRGDRSVVPSNRRHLLQLRIDRPTAVDVEGAGPIPHTRGDAGRPGWWMDDAGFLCIRLPEAVPLGVMVTLASPRS